MAGREPTLICDCPYPLMAVIGDVVVSSRLSKKGTVQVKRYCDCIYHGPRSFLLEIFPEPGLIATREQFHQPYHGTDWLVAVRIKRRFE